MIQIKIPANLYLIAPSALTGIEKLRALRNNTNVLNKSVGGMATEELKNDAEANFTTNDLLDIISAGGDVEGFSPQVKILTTDINNATPVGLIKSIKPAVMSQPTEEDDIETFESVELEPARQKTWYEWANLDSNNFHASVVDEYSYFAAHFCGKTKQETVRGKLITTTGHCLSGTELMVIHNSSDAELVSKTPEIIIE